MEGTPTARLRVVDGGAPGLRVDLTERCPAFRFSARPVSDYRFAWKATTSARYFANDVGGPGPQVAEMDAAYDPGAWHDLGVALVSASAALLGLVFVVVSLHLRAVVDDPVLRRRAEIMLGLLAMTLAASAALLIPEQSREALGIELMPIALIYITLSTLATFRATHAPQGVSRDRLARFIIGELSAGLVFAGGLGLLVHALGGAYLAAAGVVLGVLIAMLAIWILFLGLELEQREG